MKCSGIIFCIHAQYINLSNFRYWQEGEPNDPTASGDEDCVELLQTSPLRSWNDRVCSAEINYICEKQSE